MVDTVAVDPVAVDTAAPSRLMASTYDPVPTAATRIRRRLRSLLTDRDLRGERDHAGTPFDLVVRLADGVLHVAVRDRSVRAPRLRPYDPRAVRGRGLQMVAGLSRRWGCEEHADGKTVWAELAVR